MSKWSKIAFLLVINCSVFSQSYRPIIDGKSKEWQVTSCFFGCITDAYNIVGDTNINGKDYTFLDRYHYSKNFFLREDSTNRKVYLKLRDTVSYPSEYLLYDFSLQVGDTFHVYNPLSPYPNDGGNYVLDSIIKRVLISDSSRYFYLHAVDSTVSNATHSIWVEGVGSLSLINTPGAPPNINGIGQLSCFFSDYQLTLQNLDSITQCVPQIASIHTMEKVELNVETMIQGDRIRIFNKEDENLEINMIDYLGRTIAKLRLKPNQKGDMDLSHIKNKAIVIQYHTKTKLKVKTYFVLD